LRRLIGENIELKVVHGRDLGLAKVDQGQLEQVIINLAVNARDAMPGGGTLTIRTANHVQAGPMRRGAETMPAGNYLLVETTDTGIGIPKENLERIFEPFFSTKEIGSGTGLGLSTVYGVVKQSGGFIWVYSEVGQGTSFKIYLPLVDQAVEKGGTLLPLAEAPRGTETVLLAEDEQDVRELAREFLESGGYHVIEATNGQNALSVAAQHTGSIDLLVTDMVMPGMTGQQLAARLQQQRSALAVIYMSGYSEHAATESAQSALNARLLTKPFSRNAILRAVREVLGASRPL
jgi:two-component system cell cycle sensor histidine kinase/response regulator CckA